MKDFQTELSKRNRLNAEERILKSVSILCIKCHGRMIRVRDLYDDTLVGYSCQDCPHYNLLDDNPV